MVETLWSYSAVPGREFWGSRHAGSFAAPAGTLARENATDTLGTALPSHAHPMPCKEIALPLECCIQFDELEPVHSDPSRRRLRSRPCAAGRRSVKRGQ